MIVSHLEIKNDHEIRSLSHLLLEWYQQHQRDLPWRQTRDPYAIWISEVVLQQTRIDQGTAYYHRFLKRFPRVADLAAANLDDVLEVWQGLGYYSRARNLHKAAQILVAEFGGQCPERYSDWILLPGVGSYTAAAVASIAFGEPRAVVDGNVQRLLSRLWDWEDEVGSKASVHFYQTTAQALLSGHEPGMFNQALMEFGSQWCKPGIPLCDACVLRAHCRSAERGTQRDRPVKRRTKAVPTEIWAYAIVCDPSGQMWVRKRPEHGIWGGLYEFVPRALYESSTDRETHRISISHRLTHKILQLELSIFVLPDARGWVGAPGLICLPQSDWSVRAFPRPLSAALPQIQGRMSS
ncbi:A/G-specific adenine glycosylase [bacterium]|nr:A/G-specific adenine glycosylase [bacterium]